VPCVVKKGTGNTRVQRGSRPTAVETVIAKKRGVRETNASEAMMVGCEKRDTEKHKKQRRDVSGERKKGRSKHDMFGRGRMAQMPHSATFVGTKRGDRTKMGAVASNSVKLAKKRKKELKNVT